MERTNFENLRVYQLAEALEDSIWDIVGLWKSFAREVVGGQLVRSADSIGANIAEGSAKRGTREFRRYLDIAIGSLAELSYTLMVIRDLKYLTLKQYDEVNRLRVEAGKATWGLYRSMGERNQR